MTISEPDNLDAIWDTRFRDPLNKFLDEFMDRSGRVFLIGAGCSKCAELSLMEELTKKVRDETASDLITAGILKGIQSDFSGVERSDIEEAIVRQEVLV